MSVVDPPSIARGDMESPDLAALGTYLTALAGSGMPLFPSTELEKYLLEAANLPIPEETTTAGTAGVGKLARVPTDKGNGGGRR